MSKRYRIDPDYRSAYRVCGVPCLVIQEQAPDSAWNAGQWWDIAHVVGEPSDKGTKVTARRIIAALKGAP